MNRKTRLLALVCCLLWGSAFPTIKTMYTLLDIGGDAGVKILLAGIRFTLAGIFILIYFALRYKKSPFMPDALSWRQAFLVSLTQTALMYAFYYIGIYNTTGVKAAILSQTSIFLVVILAHFIYQDDRMHRGKALGLIMGLAGIVTVNLNGFQGAGNLFVFRLDGEGFLIMASLFSTFTTFLVKKFGKTLSPILLNGWQLTLGGAMLLVVGLVTASEPLRFGPVSFLLLIYSAALSSGAFTLWYVLLQTNKASELAMMRFTIPVFGAIMSALLLPGEGLTLHAIGSLALVATGIWMCNRKGTTAPKPTLKI